MATSSKKTPPASKPVKVVKAKKSTVIVPPPPPVHVSAYKIGNRVTHPTFGDGQVTAIVRDQLSIKFATSEKVVLESFVKGSAKG